MSEHSSGFPVYWRDVMPPSLNQPSPPVKAEALALSETSMNKAAAKKLGMRPYSALEYLKTDEDLRLYVEARIELDLDSAFAAEFDLLPEDAKPLCDTFFRSLRKRLGHPVECSGKSSGAPNQMRTQP